MRLVRLQLERLEDRLTPNTYWVSPIGNDNNLGSETAPWLTLQHAANSVRPGDLVNIDPGAYTGFTDTTSRVTFQHTPGLFGMSTVAGITVDGASNVRISRLALTNPGRDGIDLINTFQAHLNGLDVGGNNIGVHLIGANQTIVIASDIGRNNVGVESDAGSTEVFLSELTISENGIGAELSGQTVLLAQSTMTGNRNLGIWLRSAINANFVNDQWSFTLGPVAFLIDNSPGTRIVNSTIVALPSSIVHQFAHPVALMIQGSMGVFVGNTILVSNDGILETDTASSAYEDSSILGNAATQMGLFVWPETFNSPFRGKQILETGPADGTADPAIMPKDDITGNLRNGDADIGAFGANETREVFFATNYAIVDFPAAGKPNNDLPVWF